MLAAVKLHSQIIGQGQPVIVLHGVFGSGDNLRLLTRLNSPVEKFQFHFLDLRNHGKSSHADDMSMQTLAKDIFTYCDEQSIEKFSLIGHSLGGKVAMTCALEIPARIQQMVNIDMAPSNQSAVNIRDHNTNLAAIQAVGLANITSRAEADKLMKPHVANPSVRQFFMKSLVRNSQGYFQWLFDFERLQKFSQQWQSNIVDLDYTNQYSAPTLFIYGVNSSFMSLDAHPIIRQYFPNAEIIGIDEAGHWVHADQPQRFLEELKFFFTSSK